jgi:hypothetical protein
VIKIMKIANMSLPGHHNYDRIISSLEAGESDAGLDLSHSQERKGE